MQSRVNNVDSEIQVTLKGAQSAQQRRSFAPWPVFVAALTHTNTNVLLSIA